MATKTAAIEEILGCATAAITTAGGDAFTPDWKEAYRLFRASPDLKKACEAIVHATKMDDPALGAVAATLAATALA